MTLEKIANKLFIIKSFRYYHNGIPFAETTDMFLRLWNPLTWVVIVIAVFYGGIRELFEEIANAAVKSNKAKQEYLKAKENGWLIDQNP